MKRMGGVGRGAGLPLAVMCAAWLCAAPAGAEVILSNGPAPARLNVVSYRERLCENALIWSELG